jgi:dCMP deaminase
MLTERWDRHFLGLATYHSRMSKDPSTRVGSVIVGPDREVISAGFNGFPRGIGDSHDRLLDRETKLQLIVHAELNAVLAAARFGMRIKGCALYLAATDDSGLVWGGPPCTRCVVEIIQSGIHEIVTYPEKAVPSRWHADLSVAKGLLHEAGIIYREVSVI